MKLSKILGVATVAALALMAFASTASATTLEVGGVAQTGSVTIEATITPPNSALLTDTSNVIANTCTAATVKGSTASPFTGTAVSGPISALSWSGCTEGNPTVDNAGTLSVEWIKNTTNGTLFSNGAHVTVPSFFGPITCTTSNTDIGTVTGVSKTTEHAIIHINAVLPCTVIGTAKWTGTYTVTSPTGLGVRS